MIMVFMETDTKQSIKEIAEQLLIWKVKGKGKKEISQIIDDPYLLACGIQHLMDNRYIAKTEKTSNPCLYHVTLEGIEYVFLSKEERAKL